MAVVAEALARAAVTMDVAVVAVTGASAVDVPIAATLTADGPAVAGRMAAVAAVFPALDAAVAVVVAAVAVAVVE